jgi:hypothetical protein
LVWDAAPLSGEEARGGFTGRMRINTSSLSTSGTYIQIKCSGGKSLTVNRAFIGEASVAGNSWDYEGTPTQIFFNDGQESGSWTGNGSVFSDIIPFNLDLTKTAYIISIERHNAGQNFYASSTGKADASWFVDNPNNADDEAPTGTTGNGLGKSLILEKLYVGG